MTHDCSTFYIKFKNNCAHPQADCMRWAEENCTQMTGGNVEVNLPMMMFIRMETREDYIERRYFAATPSHFEKSFRRCHNDAERHFHEIVVDGPVKMFVDLEMHMTDVMLKKHKCTNADELRKKCEESAAALIGYVVSWHKREHGLNVTPIVNTSHKESKWTIHVTFDGAVWRNNQHCKHFILGIIVKQSLRDPMLHDLVDKNIYEKNHPMRTYRSTKNEEPERSMLGPGEKPDSPVDLDRLRRSLITCIKIFVPQVDEGDDNVDERQESAAPKPSTEIYLSTMFMRLHITEPEVFGIKYINCPGYTTNRLLNSKSFSNGIGTIKYIETIVDTVEKSDEDRHPAQKSASVLADASSEQAVIRKKEGGITDDLAKKLVAYFSPYQPETLKIDAISGLVVVTCKSKDCLVKGSAHKRNHIFIIVDIYRQSWALRCHDDDCKAILAQSPIQWNMLPSEMDQECETSRAGWAGEMPRMFSMLNGRRRANAQQQQPQPQVQSQSND